MPSIQITRIKEKLKEMYIGTIDMSGAASPEDQCFSSRALAAVALMIKCGIDSNTSGQCITDGYHDMGIDAIYLDETQKQLYLVQSKWRENGKGSISQEEMHTFAEGINRILNLEIKGANEKITRKQSEIEVGLTQIDYQVHALYIHTGDKRLEEYAAHPINALLDKTNDEVSTILLFDELIYSDIYSYLAQGIESDNIVLDDVVLKHWGKQDAPHAAYYGTISAGTIGGWFKTYGNTLFAKNIRYYKGNTDVNEGMLKVLLNEPEQFFYYNNGIKLLCKSIRRKPQYSTDTNAGLFVLEGVSLINGAQTAGCIGNAFNQDPEQVSKANVLIQIINLGDEQEETGIQITKLSNTQNRIDNRDFAALDPVQERIRQDMSFSHYAYLYKSGDTINDPTTQITFDEAIVALACCNDDISYSTLAKRNIGALSEDIKKPPYTILINNGTNAFEIINAVRLIRILENHINTKRKELEGKERLVAIHGNRFIEHSILNKAKTIEEFCNSVATFIDDQSWIDEVDCLIPQIANKINSLYSESYPANIFKNATKCKVIKDQMDKV